MGQKQLNKPIILEEGHYNKTSLTNLRKNKIWQTIDIYKKQLEELFEIKNPKLIKQTNFKEKQNKYVSNVLKNSDLKGNWIYFPWNGILIHSLNKNDYLQLRTNRNKNLITAKEQKILYSACVGILGLSVGSGIAIGMQYQGIAKNIKLAEFDTLETSNLNRVQAGIHQIGMKKSDIAIQKIYEINPYANPIIFENGLSKINIKKFVHGKPKPHIIFEIIDDFEVKVLIRLEARKARIPVVTFANLGDSILADIDRYDLDSKTPLFNGVLGEFTQEILEKPNEDKNKYAVKIVGIKNIPQRAMDSVKEIGKTLVGRPQLSSTVAINSALSVYVTRRIMLGDKELKGRKLLKFDEFLKNK